MTKILEPINLKHLAVKNRIVRSATHSFIGNDDGTFSEEEYMMYEELAKNKVGMIITGHCSVSALGMANPDQTCIYDDSYIEQFAELKKRVAPHDAKIIIQINHAGPRSINNDDLAGVCAGQLKHGKEARELTIAEIEAICQQFIDAAVRLQKSGVDGVEIHAAHSYLLSQFMDKKFNHRTGAYGGGSIEERFRLTREVIEGIKAACGSGFPVLVKINNDSEVDDEAYEADLLYMINEMDKLGVEAVELSGADFVAKPRTDRVYYIDRAARMKKQTSVPLILVGGIRSLEEMDNVLASGIDMVACARPFISNPDFINLLLDGLKESRCLNCCKCFALPKIKKGIRCVFNRKVK